MNILFVEPRYYTAKTQDYFPIGPAYVASVLIRDGHHVEFVNANHVSPSWEELAGLLEPKVSCGNFHLFAMGGLCTTFEFQEKVFRSVRMWNPGMTLVGGGNLVSSEPEFCFNRFNLDFGILGEGEIPMRELCRALEHGKDTADVPGLIFRSGEQVSRNKTVCVKNLDDIPFPAWELVSSGEEIRKRGHMPVFTSRSCPFHCTFCFHPEGSRYRKRSVENVMAELECLYEHYGVRCFGFCDELFGTDKAWTLELCDRLMESEMKAVWECQMHASCSDKEMFERMKAAGCKRISMGFESGSDRVLQSMKKKIRVRDSRNAIRQVRDAGLPVTGGIIIGDFAETAETLDETLRFIKETALVPVSDVGMIVPYPGSEIYRRSLEKGLITDKASFLYALGGFDKLRINMTGMDDAELLGHQERLSMEVYAHFLKEKKAVITGAEKKDWTCSVMDYTCPTCGKSHRTTVTGMTSEIQLYCPGCCYPVYIHPLEIPHIDERTAHFRSWLDSLGNRPDAKVMVTPVGHDFMKMAEVLSFPMNIVTGFLDQSVQRLKHPFMKRPVHLRSPEILKRLAPDYVVVCSFAYQNDIASDMRTWNIENTKIIPIDG